MENLKEMHSGNAAAIPVKLKKSDKDPCDYCKMKPICRIKTKGRHR